MFVSPNRQLVSRRKDRWGEGAEDLTVHIVRGGSPIRLVIKDEEPPARAFHSYDFIPYAEVKDDSGNMGEVPEVSDGFWEVVSKRRFDLAELES